MLRLDACQYYKTRRHLEEVHRAEFLPEYICHKTRGLRLLYSVISCTP